MCEIGVKIFYDGMADSVIEAWRDAEAWYVKVANEDPHLLELFEHLKISHNMGPLSFDLGLMIKQHKAAEIMGDFKI